MVDLILVCFAKREHDCLELGKVFGGFLNQLTEKRLIGYSSRSILAYLWIIDMLTQMMFTPTVKYFIAFGLISCVNSDNCSIYFSNRRVESAFGENLKWRVAFNRATVEKRHLEEDDDDEELVLTSYAVEYELDVEEVYDETDDDDALVGATEVHRSRYPHSVTKQYNLYKTDYFFRVYFGNWRGLDMIDYEYEAFSEIRIKYDYDV